MQKTGEFTFEFVDEAGNYGTATAKVDWIDREAPIGILNYDIVTKTNKDVTVTIEFDKEDAYVINNDGNTSYTFEENGEFTFQFADEAGNSNYIVAKVDWIDKVAPTADIEYDITSKTSEPVTATLINESEKITITNNNGKSTYTFTENGEFTFKFVDEAGNEGQKTAKVNWIDKTLPKADIKYSTTSKTYEPVTATLVNENKKITIINNNGSRTYTFTKNGEFTFEFVDDMGNVGTKTARVTWIEEKPVFETEKYTIRDGFILKIRPGISPIGSKEIKGTTVKEFKENIKTNQKMTFLSNDNKELKDEDVIGTGTVLKLGENQNYTLIVRGDIDGNGKVSVNDLAKLKLHYIEMESLTGNSLKAADIDGNGNVSMIDLAQIKLTLIGLAELK